MERQSTMVHWSNGLGYGTVYAVVGVQFPHGPQQNCPYGEIGKHGGFKILCFGLQVRVLLGAQYMAEWRNWQTRQAKDLVEMEIFREGSTPSLATKILVVHLCK